VLPVGPVLDDAFPVPLADEDALLAPP